MPIYNGSQKLKFSGKIYVGSQLVYEDTPVLTSLTITGQTTSLARGSTFSFGGSATAHYSNGTSANVTTSCTFSGYDMSTAGTYTVTVSYTEGGITKTATYSLTVNKAWTTIWSGTKSLQWSNTSSSAPSAVAITDPNVTGSQTFRITWTENTNTYNAYGPQPPKTYYNNGTRTTTKPGSPLQFTIDTSAVQTNRVGMGRYGTGNLSYEFLVVDYRPHGNSTRPGFYIRPFYYNQEYNISLKMTVSKIERYY